MHCFRDASSLQRLIDESPPSELSHLIKTHLDALAAFDDVPLGDLANFFILSQGDSANTLVVLMDRNLSDIAVETCTSHAGWFELVIIVSDDGFGYIVFIPKTINDQSLLDFCASQALRTQEGTS
ncbi:hypothetical protein [Roseateles sp. LKC17W]|uniref:Uncharacterized protein n=1 Tax=Pelomonas margarita TaxID=3299031 RepID=A0ABW7FGZ0_9BURK